MGRNSACEISPIKCQKLSQQGMFYSFMFSFIILIFLTDQISNESYISTQDILPNGRYENETPGYEDDSAYEQTQKEVNQMKTFYK